MFIIDKTLSLLLVKNTGKNILDIKVGSKMDYPFRI